MTATATAKQDNLFGICAALGEDFGIDPLWLRMAFAIALLANLEIVLATYFGLGVVVLASRLLAPRPIAQAPSAVALSAAMPIQPPLRQAA